METLSLTERQVIEMRLGGYSRKEIAVRTFRSELTIKTHFQNIARKTETKDEIDLAVWYIENQIGKSIRKCLTVTLMMALVLIAEFTATKMIRTRQTTQISTTARPQRNRRDTYEL